MRRQAGNPGGIVEDYSKNKKSGIYGPGASIARKHKGFLISNVRGLWRSGLRHRASRKLVRRGVVIFAVETQRGTGIRCRLFGKKSGIRSKRSWTGLPKADFLLGLIRTAEA